MTGGVLNLMEEVLKGQFPGENQYPQFLFLAYYFLEETVIVLPSSTLI